MHDMIESVVPALAAKSEPACARKRNPVDRNYDLFEILPDGSACGNALSPATKTQFSNYAN